MLVGAVGIEIASLLSKPNKGNGVAPAALPNWCHLVPCLMSRRRDKLEGSIRDYLRPDPNELAGTNGFDAREKPVRALTSRPGGLISHAK